jgi:hypothetical protein
MSDDTRTDAIKLQSARNSGAVLNVVEKVKETPPKKVVL